MMIPLNRALLEERTELNYRRLTEDPYYSASEIFTPPDYDWYGDKEGRALLAFVSHAKISGKRAPAMEDVMRRLPSKVNEGGYLGPVFTQTVHEQQLSGHSWLLCGLCEHYGLFGDPLSLSLAQRIVEGLYLPLRGRIATYPVHREQRGGGVSGNTAESQNGWQLSTDVGCAFMAIDGLARFYAHRPSEELLALLCELSECYAACDKEALRAQTHCTLTAARGMALMYKKTENARFLQWAEEILTLYLSHGITATYHNLNWFGRPDSWSEPCAVVDSLILACELYKLTSKEAYRKAAARIYRNAFSFLQRDNGGAGPDTLVCQNSPWDHLAVHTYEAPFCCTMRLAEGLWYVKEHAHLLYAEEDGILRRGEDGIYRNGDTVLVSPCAVALPYAEDPLLADGIPLCPIPPLWRIPKEDALRIRLRVRF